MPRPNAPKAPATIRAFVALDLDTLSHRRVVRLSDRLRMSSGTPSATWTTPDKLHVTLKFIESLDEGDVEKLGKALGKLAEGAEAPPACGLRLEAFPRKQDARVVVAELTDDAGAIAGLAAKVEKLTTKLGVPVERRKFRPHVTLARLRLPFDARKWLRPELTEVAGDCRAGALTLYRSILDAEGSTYERLARFDYSTSTQTS
jgi:2'-5' RNA ligase